MVVTVPFCPFFVYLPCCISLFVSCWFGRKCFEVWQNIWNLCKSLEKYVQNAICTTNLLCGARRAVQRQVLTVFFDTAKNWTPEQSTMVFTISLRRRQMSKILKRDCENWSNGAKERLRNSINQKARSKSGRFWLRADHGRGAPQQAGREAPPTATLGRLPLRTRMN